MIRVTPPKAPDHFKNKVQTPGMAFLKPFLDKGTKPTSWKNKDFWKHVRKDLREAFNSRCGYVAMRELGDGEVDHFISKDEEPAKAYEWDNYRFANNEVNKKKNTAKAVLDPFKVEDDWFEVNLVSGEVVIKDVPPGLRQLAEDTITDLGINKDSYNKTRLVYSEGCMKDRPSEQELARIEKLAPLVAKAIRKFWE